MNAVPEQEVGGPDAGQQEPRAVVLRGESVPVVAESNDTVSMTNLLQMAVEKNLDVDKLEKLIALKERMEDRNAAHEFFDAMAAFQAECPPVPKNKMAKFATRSGAEMNYAYAELDIIAKHIGPHLHKRGLSYSWDTKIEGNSLTVICYARHRSGHVVASSTVLPIDNPSAMSPAQKVGAAMTFGQRKTLCQAFGITTAETDTDARGESVDPTPITDHQASDIEALLSDAKASRQKFLDYLKAESVEKLRAVDYPRAVALLQEKIRAREAKAAK